MKTLRPVTLASSCAHNVTNQFISWLSCQLAVIHFMITTLSKIPQSQKILNNLKVYPFIRCRFHFFWLFSKCLGFAWVSQCI